MNRKILITIILLLNGWFLQAQITITSADMPNIGDTLRYSQASPTSVIGYNFATTGANHTWDFSNLTHVSQSVDTFVSVLSTPIFYYPSFLTNASIARKGESFGAMGFSLTNVYEFYKETNTYFAQVGFAAQLNGIPLPTLFSAPDYIYRFPLNYGNTDSCSFGYTFSVPGLITYKNQSKRVNVVDGWGTLTTPFGTFQTVRVKSTITSRDSIASDSLPFPVPPITTTTIEYKWLANGYRAPLLTATAGGMGMTTVTYMDSYKPTSGTVDPGLSKSGDRLNIDIHPNPVGSTLNFITGLTDNGLKVYLRIFDATGRVVMDRTSLSTTPALDVSGLKAGIYYLHLATGDGKSGVARFIRL